jgi:hypothetical protein
MYFKQLFYLKRPLYPAYEPGIQAAIIATATDNLRNCISV